MSSEMCYLGEKAVAEINAYLSSKKNSVIQSLVNVIKKYGTPQEINERAKEARKAENLIARLKHVEPSYVKDLEWLEEQKERKAFVSISDFRKKVLGKGAGATLPDESSAVTLEISALQYFPWFIAEAKRAIEKGELMPGRYIRVRNMREQVKDGDLLAVHAATEMAGASCVETLDTKGTDGSNIHLMGPETITGYFGGIGQPNEHALAWVDEFLHYYTNYGAQEVLNVNEGTILLALLLYKLGVDIKFKISVFKGIDNPYSFLWTLIAARLLARDDGTTALSGINLSNSVNAATIKVAAQIRRDLGFEDQVRIEHHITETAKSIVRQPYCRRDELIEVATTVPNISAKHEGGDFEDEASLDHPSDILDYFRAKEEVIASGHWESLEKNYMLKHIALNRTAESLTKHGIAFVAARGLHSR